VGVFHKFKALLHGPRFEFYIVPALHSIDGRFKLLGTPGFNNSHN